MNGTIGKQMVDTLVESASNVEVPFLLVFICKTVRNTVHFKLSFEIFHNQMAHFFYFKL